MEIKDLRKQYCKIEIDFSTIGYGYPLDEVVNSIIGDMKNSIKEHLPTKDTKCVIRISN